MFWDVGGWRCGMFGMWDVQDGQCRGCEMLGMGCCGSGMSGMWDVWDTGYWECGMLGMCDVWDVRCSGCGMFAGMCDVGLQNAKKRTVRAFLLPRTTS